MVNNVKGALSRDELSENLTRYVQSNIDEDFSRDGDPLIDYLDSVALLQLILHIDEELGYSLDMASLSLEMFSSIDSLVDTLS